MLIIIYCSLSPSRRAGIFVSYVGVKWCLARSRHSATICWINECVNDRLCYLHIVQRFFGLCGFPSRWFIFWVMFLCECSLWLVSAQSDWWVHWGPDAWSGEASLGLIPGLRHSLEETMPAWKCCQIVVCAESNL